MAGVVALGAALLLKLSGFVAEQIYFENFEWGKQVVFIPVISIFVVLILVAWRSVATTGSPDEFVSETTASTSEDSEE